MTREKGYQKKSYRVAECVTERLAIRTTLGLELFADGAVLVPSFRKSAVAVPHLFELGLPVRKQSAANAPGDANPFLAIIGNDLGDLVIAALCLGDLLGDVADIDKATGVKPRPVIDQE
jgi:hypothetical protein